MIYNLLEDIPGLILLIFVNVTVSIIIISDIVKNWKYIKDFFKQCKNEIFNLPVTLTEKSEKDELLKTDYPRFRKYLSVYAFYAYQIISFQYIQNQKTYWPLVICIIISCLSIWRTPVPKNKQSLRALFLVLFLMLPYLILIKITQAPLEIVTATSLFAGLFIWIDSTCIVDYLKMPDEIKWAKNSIKTIASNDNKYLVLKDYFNVLTENENRKMRFALTLYSVGCLGLLIKFLDIDNVGKLSIKEDFKEMIGWAVILGTYATFGWAKGILLSSLHHRDKINECIKEMIEVK